MLYLLAIVLPPVAVLVTGRPLQAVLNLVLTLCFWVPGMVHALLVVHAHIEDKRAERVIEAVRGRAG